VTVLGQVCPLSTSLSRINDAALIEQLSVAVLPAFVNAPRVWYTGFSPAAQTAVRFAGQVNVGAALSTTVTVATQVETLPVASVTVSVTLLSPTSVQSNALSLITVDVTPQLSVLPPSTSAATIVTLPVPFRFTVISSHTAVGS